MQDSPCMSIPCHPGGDDAVMTVSVLCDLFRLSQHPLKIVIGTKEGQKIRPKTDR